MVTERYKPKQNDKIAIIGAGPAGVHIGYLLKQKGFKHITIFEKNNRIGGKSYSINQEGLIHEMGTCYFTVTYQKILDLISQHNISDRVGVFPQQRRCILANKETMIVADWLMEEIAKMYLPPYWRIFTKHIANMALIKAINRYNKLHSQFCFSSPYDIPQNADPEKADILAQPMSTFLNEHHLSVLSPVFLLQNGVMCYGYPDTTSTYYGLYWMNSRLLTAYLEYIKGKKNQMLMGMLKEGFQEIWKKLAEVAQLEIKLNMPIEKIERGNLTENDSYITLSYKKNNETVQENFDFLISAIPAQHTLKLLDAPSEFEKNTFSQQLFSKVITCLVEVENPRMTDTLGYWLHYLNSDNHHRVFAFRNAAPILIQQEKSSQTLVCYQYYDNEKYYDEQLAKEYFTLTLEEYGVKINEILATEVWQYFPRFNAAAIREKLPWKIKAEQGKNRTWYVGSSVCFESVNAVVNYNHYIIDDSDLNYL